MSLGTPNLTARQGASASTASSGAAAAASASSASSVRASSPSTTAATANGDFSSISAGIIQQTLKEFSYPIKITTQPSLEMASLFLRIKYSGILEAREEPIQTALNEIHAHVEPIPFLEEDISLEKSFEQILANHTKRLHDAISNPKAGSKLDKLKTIVWNLVDRSEFETRQDLGKKLNLAAATVQDQQGLTDLGPKYDDIQLCVDLSECSMLHVGFTDLDHMDSWSSIRDKVDNYFEKVNLLPVKIKAAVFGLLSSKTEFLGYFMKENLSKSDFKILPTLYLQHCLYNYTANLTSINRPANLDKSNKDPIDWLMQQELFGKSFIQYLLKEGCKEMDLNLDAITDTKTGFFTKIRKIDNVDPRFRGKPLGRVCREYILQHPRITAIQKTGIQFEKSKHWYNHLNRMLLQANTEEDKRDIEQSLREMDRYMNMSTSVRNGGRRKLMDASGSGGGADASAQLQLSSSDGSGSDSEERNSAVLQRTKRLIQVAKATALAAQAEKKAAQAIALANQEKDQKIALANQEKEQAIALAAKANQEKDQAIALAAKANQEKDQEIATLRALLAQQASKDLPPDQKQVKRDPYDS